MPACDPDASETGIHSAREAVGDFQVGRFLRWHERKSGYAFLLTCRRQSMRDMSISRRRCCAGVPFQPEKDRIGHFMQPLVHLAQTSNYRSLKAALRPGPEINVRVQCDGVQLPEAPRIRVREHSLGVSRILFQE